MSKATSNFLNCITARHEILRCNKRIGVPEETFISICSASRVALMAVIARYNFSDQDAADAMCMISDGPFRDEDKQVLIAAITARLEDTPAVADGVQAKRALQVADHIFLYFTESEWRNQLVGPLQARINFCCKRAIELGILSPTERSWASIAAVIAWNLDLDNSQMLEVVRDAKRVLRSMSSKTLAN